MNIFNSKALLILLLVFATLGNITIANDTLSHKKEAPSKEIIIVNLDDQFSTQMSGLTDYVFSLYINNADSKVSIKTYGVDADDLALIDEIKSALTSKGINKLKILIDQKVNEATAQGAYFTITVTKGAELQ